MMHDCSRPEAPSYMPELKRSNVGQHRRAETTFLSHADAIDLGGNIQTESRQFLSACEVSQYRIA